MESAAANAVQAEPCPAQESPESVFRKALEWIRDDGAQFSGTYSAKIAADALRAADDPATAVVLNLPSRFRDFASKVARVLAQEPLEVYAVRCLAAGMAADAQRWVDGLLALEGETDDGTFARLEGELLELAGLTRRPA